MAGTKAHYAGEDRGYGSPSNGPSKGTGAGRMAGGNLINGTNNTKAKNGVMNGAKIPSGSAGGTQDPGVNAYKGGKVIGGRGLDVKNRK